MHTVFLLEAVRELKALSVGVIFEEQRINTRKHSNEAIYYNVSFLEEALQQKKKASFYYFDLDENG